MKTRNCGRWSELSIDILRSVFERLSFVDFHRAKIVCANWYWCSKETARPKSGSCPFLILFQEDGCPDEDRVYKAKRDLSGYRFLGNSGKWFLVVDAKSNLSIIDVFSENKLELPPLESIQGKDFSLERVGDGEFKEKLIGGCKSFSIQEVENLRGLLWFDETKKKIEYVVVWYFNTGANFIAYCKKGGKHYREIPTRIKLTRELRGISDIVVRGDSLYVLTTRKYVRVLDLCREEGFRDISNIERLPMLPPALTEDEAKRIGDDVIIRCSRKIAVTRTGEVLLVQSMHNETVGNRIFRLFKKDLNTDDSGDEVTFTKIIKVDCLVDEALFLDLGITVPADHTLGIEPNSIYFTNKCSCMDMCVFNLATNTFKHIATSSFNSNLKDARWLLPFPSPYC